MRFLKHGFITLFMLLICVSAVAQNIGGIDFSTLKADDLSDQQVQQLYERMQERNLTIAEVEAMAIARGTSPAEVAKLKNRLNEIRNAQVASGQQLNADDRSRTIVNQQNYPSDMVKEATSVDTLALLLEMPEPDSVEIFGAKIFSNQNITFEPSMNIATPANYVLGAGDELIVDIWGASENTYQLPVSPEGSVQISAVGPVQVSGLTIEEATRRLTDRLSRIYSGLKGQNPNTFIRVTLGNIRSIKVSIIGEITAPGTYTLSSFATVFNALYASGGPNKSGSFRNIKILRGDEAPREVDLYKFLVDGDLSGNLSLKDQDIIKVDAYLNRIEVRGEAKRTGFFETKDGETVSDVLNFAGGFNENAYTKRIKIERRTATEKSIVDVPYPERANTVVQPGDVITIGKILDRYENKVTVEGAIFRPGDYQLENNPTLYALINNAEGLRGDAYLERVIIYRTRPDYQLESIAINLQDLLDNPQEYDIELVKDDFIQISSIFDLQRYRTVTVHGSVNLPGNYPYAQGFTLKDLILEADGFSDEASPYRIEVARRITDKSEQVQNRIADILTIDLPAGLVYHPELDDIVLMPFDQVFVRKSPGYETQKMVRIEGEVLFPGTYVLSDRDYRLTDLIRSSGGLTPFAFPEGASLEREFKTILNELELNLADTIAGKEVASLSKVGINLEQALRRPNSEYDLLLHPGDLIHVPKKLQTVQIRGEVLYPVNTRYQDGKSFRSYIAAAGGFTDRAQTNRAYIVYANGEVDRTNRFLFFKSYPEVRPGSVIIIPPEEEKERLSTAERITVMSTIVSLAAIVTNTIFQIRRN